MLCGKICIPFSSSNIQQIAWPLLSKLKCQKNNWAWSRTLSKKAFHKLRTFITRSKTLARILIHTPAAAIKWSFSIQSGMRIFLSLYFAYLQLTILALWGIQYTFYWQNWLSMRVKVDSTSSWRTRTLLKRLRGQIHATPSRPVTKSFWLTLTWQTVAWQRLSTSFKYSSSTWSKSSIGLRKEHKTFKLLCSYLKKAIKCLSLTSICTLCQIKQKMCATLPLRWFGPKSILLSGQTSS
jgi:hypothetical protein